MKKYEAYKDSGVQWLGKIPSHWELRKMKYLFDERSEKNHPDEPMLSATQTEGVILQSKYKNRVVVVNTGFEGLKLVKVGDFVIHLRSFQGGIEYTYDQGIISSAYIILSPKHHEYSDYFKRLLKSTPYIDLLKVCVTGIREGQNINYAKLKQNFIPLPPLPEQQAIVSYLDDKCAKLDLLVTNKEKEIELLQEMKQRVIADAVIRGLNPNVQFKDTGILWMPKIPAHWQFNRVKHLFSHHKIIAKEKSTEYERLALTMAGVIKRDKEDGTGLQPDNFDTYQVVFSNDIIFKLIDLNNISTSRVGLSPYTGIVSPAYIVLSPKEKTRVNFFEYFFKDMWHRCIFNALGDNGVRSSLSTTDVLSLPLPVPPIDEQQAIVAYIEERAAKIDTLAQKLQQEIDNIKEYKQCLISDVVTGQIKVY